MALITWVQYERVFWQKQTMMQGKNCDHLAIICDHLAIMIAILADRNPLRSFCPFFNECITTWTTSAILYTSALLTCSYHHIRTRSAIWVRWTRYECTHNHIALRSAQIVQCSGSELRAGLWAIWVRYEPLSTNSKVSIFRSFWPIKLN